MLVSFWHCYKVHTITVNSRLDCPCNVVHTLVICVYPKIWLADLPPRNIFSRRTPPVFSLLIMSYLQHSHPRKMGSRHHIGKARIFVGRRDCRSASVLCPRDRFEFFAYPNSFMGGGKFVTHIQLSWVQRLSGARHRGRVRYRQGQTPPPFC